MIRQPHQIGEGRLVPDMKRSQNVKDTMKKNLHVGDDLDT